MAYHTFVVNPSIPLKADNVRMTLLFERINFAVDDYEKRRGVKFSNAAMAEHVGVTRQTVGDWRKGRTLELKGKNLLKTSEYLEVSQSWLSNNKSRLTITSMRQGAKNTDKSHAISELIECYQKSDQSGREHILATARHEASRNEEDDLPLESFDGKAKGPVPKTTYQKKRHAKKK
jgi:transcriptional regulator with XRE-family HTH domain